MNKALILPYNNIYPEINSRAFIAPSASIIGAVKIDQGSGVWFNCTIRGDVEPIYIGKNTNIQDGTVIHCTRGGYKTTIGNNVTVGHNAILHACNLEDESFIGMGAIIMDKAIVKTGAMVAAGALVPPGKIIPKGEIWAGNPAKFLRKLTKEESDFIMTSANNYLKLAQEYLQNLNLIKN